MNKLLRHILIFALLNMALLGVAHANSPQHQDADELQECTFHLHHSGLQLHTAPNQLVIPQPLETTSSVVTKTYSTVFVRHIRPFYGRAPPQTT